MFKKKYIIERTGHFQNNFYAFFEEYQSIDRLIHATRPINKHTRYTNNLRTNNIKEKLLKLLKSEIMQRKQEQEK